MIDPKQIDFDDTPVAATRPAAAFAPADPGAAPSVSIVTPYFRPGPLFRETARSVFRQSLQQFEWIIVDDASCEDGAAAELSELEASDPRVRVVRLEENVGRSAARNLGTARARSEFIYTLDHDDLLEATAIEKSLWFLSAHPEYGFANGWSVAFGAKRFVWNQGFSPPDVFLERNVVSGRALIRKSVLEQVGGFDEAIVDGFEDWDLWMRCADRGIWGGTIPECLDWFRRREPPANWENPDRAEAFRLVLRERYPALWRDGMPGLPSRREEFAPLTAPPCSNTLSAERRVLVVMDGAHANESLAHLLAELASSGWQLTLVALTASRGVRHCTTLSDDAHIVEAFVEAEDVPSYVAYLASSRRPAAIVATGAPLAAALLPLLASTASDPRSRLAALLPRRGAQRANLRPRLAAWIAAPDAVRREEVIALRPLCDFFLVGSSANREALLRAGLDEERVRLAASGEAQGWIDAEPSRARGTGGAKDAEVDTERRAHAASALRLLVQNERDRRAKSHAQAELDEQRSLLRDLTHWGEDLAEALRWFEEQRDRWKATADERDERLAEQASWIAKLQEACDWYEEQRRHWMTVADERAGALERSEAESRDEATRMSERFEGLMTERDALAARIAALESGLGAGALDDAEE